MAKKTVLKHMMPMPKGHEKVAKVMHEFKAGTLKSGTGKKVVKRPQAVAIGLSEQRKKGKEK